MKLEAVNYLGKKAVISALIAGGPAEGIDEYEHGADACEAYVNCVWSRRTLGLKHFLAIADLRSFLCWPHQNEWEEKQDPGWNESRRKAMQALCDDIFAWETWRVQILSALSATDDRTLYQADAAAKWLSIDTWEVHFARVKAAPLTSSSWFRLMQQTGESRIESVLAFAESVLPFDQSDSPEVINAKIETLEDGGKEILASLGYMWHDPPEEVKVYPGLPLVYLLIEGDTCIGVVCEEIDLE